MKTLKDEWIEFIAALAVERGTDTRPIRRAPRERWANWLLTRAQAQNTDRGTNNGCPPDV